MFLRNHHYKEITNLKKTLTSVFNFHGGRFTPHSMLRDSHSDSHGFFTVHFPNTEFGLAFIAYPEAVTLLPISPLWAILFFFMLITLGMDSQFCIIETVTTAIIDEFPSLRKKKHLVVFAYCFMGFIFGLSCVTQAGGYWVILMDKYAADFALLIFGLCECIGIGWIYGARRFINDIRTMLGDRIVDHPLFNFWPLCWCCITPGVLLFVLGFNWATWEFPTAGDYEFPTWAHVIGWLMISSSLVCIPAVWAFEFIRAGGSFADVSTISVS